MDREEIFRESLLFGACQIAGGSLSLIFYLFFTLLSSCLLESLFRCLCASLDDYLSTDCICSAFIDRSVFLLQRLWNCLPVEVDEVPRLGVDDAEAADIELINTAALWAGPMKSSSGLGPVTIVFNHH